MSPHKATKASLSLEFNSKWILISELHWQTDNQEEEEKGKEEKKKKMARKEELEEEKISVIKKAKKVEFEKKSTSVESEIEYRRDMPDIKTEVPVREVVGKKKNKEEEKNKDQVKKKKEEEMDVDRDSVMQVAVQCSP